MKEYHEPIIIIKKYEIIESINYIDPSDPFEVPIMNDSQQNVE